MRPAISHEVEMHHTNVIIPIWMPMRHICIIFFPVCVSCSPTTVIGMLEEFGSDLSVLLGWRQEVS